MKACIIFSLLFHILFVWTFQKAFPLQWNMEEVRTYQVELIRPPVDDIDTEELSNMQMRDMDQEEVPPQAIMQDTISLDTKDERYISYAGLIKQQIMHHWRYPPKAKEYLIEGDLVAFFSLNRDGTMIQVSILKASGHDILDNEVIRAIKSAAPFSPFPSSIQVNRLNIKANFDYQLTAGR
ncbi:MAG: energy transducer TonB [Deltaproteobacteria bacterium]|nr:energy transducer TonB [Deltaproteobacteria bacterium]